LGGFHSLSDPEKLFFAAGLVELEVNNGGFEQYFFNSSAQYYDYALQALREMDAESTILLLDRAKQSLFPSGEMPLDTGARRELMAARSEPSSEIEELDTSFFTDPDGLNARLRGFADKHHLRA
jgi:hypothetical protein